MGYIDGAVVNLLTFPGILVHQGMLLLACRLLHVQAAFSIFHFTSQLSSRLVLIGETDEALHGKRLERLAIAGSAVAAMLCGAFSTFFADNNVVIGVCLWLALSIGVHSFPWRRMTGGAVLAYLWLDAFYGTLLFGGGMLVRSLFKN